MTHVHLCICIVYFTTEYWFASASSKTQYATCERDGGDAEWSSLPTEDCERTLAILTSVS